MLMFIFLNLVVGLVLDPKNEIWLFLQSEWMGYLGCGLLLISFIIAVAQYKKFSYKLRYDLFAVGAFFVWFSYWPPFFRDEAPLFNVFPLYFSFIAALFSLIFIKKRDDIERDTLIFLQWLSDSGRFNPLIIMMGVMVSLAFPEHFLLFPITITLWVTRFALACCLDNE